MSRVFITGSSDGLGMLAARQLINEGHKVVLHARNEQRALDAQSSVPGAPSALIGDLADLDAVKNLATEVNAAGPFDAIIHNAGVYNASGEEITIVNVIAPYLLTRLIHKPQRLIYMSSGMHRGGNVDFDKLKNKQISYSDSKLYINLLTMALSRRWPDVLVNAVDPGWVPTKMGGKNATGDLDKGYETQSWLAVSGDEEATVSGSYWYHLQQQPSHADALDEELQNQFLQTCEKMTKVVLP